MSTTDTQVVAMQVQTENMYDIRRIVARFVLVQESGEFHNILWDRFGATASARHLADLAITAYVGERDYSSGSRYRNGKVWGCGHEFEPHRITTADHARSIANTLAKIQRGMDKLNGEAGYLAPDDFHGYALRIASILKVRTIYVRNLRRGQEMSGQRYRKVDGSGFQHYVASVEQYAEKGDYHELNER